jgi:rubredoxin
VSVELWGPVQPSTSFTELPLYVHCRNLRVDVTVFEVECLFCLVGKGT